MSGGLRTVPDEPHIISLRSVPGVGACVETLGLFVAGFIEGNQIAASDFIFEIAEYADEKARFVARLRHPASENPSYKAIGALYSLMAGFHKAGADVEIEGPLSDLLPGKGRLAHAPADTRSAFRVCQIFEDQLHGTERTKPIEPEALEQIYMALDGAPRIGGLIDEPDFRAIFPAVSKDPRSDTTWLLRHSSDIEVAALETDGVVTSHCILGHRSLPLGRMFAFPVPIITSVRTWGEAWIGHCWGGRRARPEGLEMLPDEVAIIHDVSVYRYRIADRATLGDLSKITFGTGPSPFSARVWLGMAEQCAEAGNYELAARCCDEAALCGEDAKTTAFATGEAVHWRDRRQWIDAQPRSPSKPVTKTAALPIADLIQRLGPNCADQLTEVIRDMRFEREDAHDHRRRVNCIPAWPETGHGNSRFSLSYDGLTGRDLIAATIPPQILLHLGVSDPIPPPARFPRIFTLRCGDAVIWGAVETGCLILLGNRPLAYSIDRL